MTLPLPLETARRIARAAISSLDVSLRLDVDAIAPTYSWVVVTLSSHQLNGHAGETLRRNIRESLRVLTALAACKGFAVKENATFWSDVWPEDPAYEQQQPQWAVKWKHLRLRGLQMPSTDTLKFLFRAWDGEVGGRSHADVMALVEELMGDTQESDSAGFRLTMEILGRHIEQDKWPLQVECGVETTQEHADRWSRLVRAAKHREQAELTKMWTQFQFTECFLSAQHCLERSGVLRDVAAVFQTQGGAIPVTELMLNFGWNSNERNLEKRLRELKALMWNVASLFRLLSRCGSFALYYRPLFQAI
ncbi:hypothetical protein PR001_g10385 [Phytophthora rubi]|uniref:Uncharacterized protein n=1 Tax=Phytophthora rubi TaxID=129364 RepID=A0A6A3M0G3_9STRA|nr:hypothetical protein PR002_g11607 [Phytophthora rubi]KAE9032920.1 hypothetical protein PR001_g10385 [Phytophthora rubi]